MRTNGVHYSFEAKIWYYDSPGGWYFVSLPQQLSQQIRAVFKSEEQGWGRLKATAQIGNTRWETAVWFESKKNAYILPLKSEIRKKEQLTEHQNISVRIWI